MLYARFLNLSGKKEVPFPAADLYLDDVQAIIEILRSIPTPSYWSSEVDDPTITVGGEKRSIEILQKQGGSVKAFTIDVGANRYLTILRLVAFLSLPSQDDSLEALKADQDIRQILEFRKNVFRDMFAQSPGSFMSICAVAVVCYFFTFAYMLVHQLANVRWLHQGVAAVVVVSASFILGSLVLIWAPYFFLGFHTKLRLKFSHDPSMSPQDKKNMIVALVAAFGGAILGAVLTKLFGK